MSRQEQPILIEGLSSDVQKNRLELLPLEHIIDLMSTYHPHEKWVKRVLPELITITETENIQFNLNINIGRLVLCDYPHKIVISSATDPNNKSREIAVSKGTFLKDMEFVTNELNISRDNLTKLGITRILGIYGQLNFSNNNDAEFAKEKLNVILTSLDGKIDGVITSGSLLGIGGIGHELANTKNLKTIGIIPQTVVGRTDPSKFDLLLVQGEDWGDGSFAFGGIATNIIFMGGGYWSYLEYKYGRYFGIPTKLFQNSAFRYSKEFRKDLQTHEDLDPSLESIIKSLSSQS